MPRPADRSAPAGALALLLLAAGPAGAACTAPSPPPAAEKPAKPVLPPKPACLDAKAGCPGWEAYTYGDQIKAYNAQLGPFRTGAEAYAGKLKAFVDASVAYANCEMKTLQ
ncbi:hypothetical protein [Methylobacterium oryzihabitans]|uniref:Uncharacterized protein n=1 Tax=Methylobacterium oryzihabitans TaxID=2499852 RepID=A0A3S2VBJ5_9HYPH|nr:hypothetical protein [Methylobacterium oryzihabitans]RVU20558.1 hypothetical protein EOE48_04190 [Methylobacterium oryzihabitans]